MKNRRKIALGWFWASKGVPGSRRDALGTRPGRAKAGPRAILGRPGRAKSGRETTKSDPGTAPRRSEDRPERRRRAFGARSTVGRVIGTIFRRFCLDARKLRCAFRTTVASVLLPSSKVTSERARTTETHENRAVSASQIEPGSVRATQNRARAAKVARQNAKKSREAQRNFFLWARTSQSERKCALETAKAACGSRRPRGTVRDYR